MYKLGLIGYPLSHSISGVIQKAGLQSLNLEGTYDILETNPEDLINRIKYLKVNDYNGFNVTIPLKVPIALFLETVDRYADIAGCANTIKVDPKDKSFHGYNTDIYGFQNAIPKDVDLKGKTVSILGTGGASRAATIGVAELGVKEINFYTRNIINSSNTVNYFREKFPEIKINVYQIQVLSDLSNTDMLVNTTPIGMRSKAMGEMPVSKTVLASMKKESLVYDVIYNPMKTALLEEAEKQGLRTINGLDMLIYQGAKAMEIWTGKYPDVKDMKIAALQVL